MAILEIDGLLGGKRLRRCSGEARWHYGYYLLLANGYARIELDFEAIAEHFVSFRDTAPTAESVRKDFSEYQANHLIYVYSFGGRTWAQFDTKRSNTKHHKTAVDRRSPHPPEGGYQTWLKEQHPGDWGLYHWSSVPDCVPDSEVPEIQQVIKSYETSEKVTEISEDLSRGVGVGLGVGEGDGNKTKSKPSARGARSAPNGSQVSKSLAETKHHRIAGMIIAAWNEHNPGATCPFGDADGKQLKLLLEKTTGWPDTNYMQCLANIYKTEGFPRSELPMHFLPRLPSYFSRPKDRYNRELGNGNRSTSKAGERNAGNLQALVSGALGDSLRGNDVHHGRPVQPGTVCDAQGPTITVPNGQTVEGKP